MAVNAFSIYDPHYIYWLIASCNVLFDNYTAIN